MEGQLVDGTFELQQHLGSCRHTAVFLTTYQARRAAIKLVDTGSVDAELQLARWELVAALSHPHLIRFYQMGRCQLGDRGLIYIVMEYAQENLSQVLRERPLTPAEAREMIEPALDALAYLHDKGFVHGHVKPANIMAVDEQLKISSDVLLRSGENVAPSWAPSAYDAPEISRGEISPAADVWSLSATLVEALTLRSDDIDLDTLPSPFAQIARGGLK
ncbi:MAG: protein kinase domain-containing protein, partial [Bryobacteraceae bacterium]